MYHTRDPEERLMPFASGCERLRNYFHAKHHDIRGIPSARFFRSQPEFLLGTLRGCASSTSSIVALYKAMEREIEREVRAAFVEIAKARSWIGGGSFQAAHDALQQIFKSALNHATPELRRAAFRSLEEAVTRQLSKLDPYTSVEKAEKQRIEAQIEGLTREYYKAKVDFHNAESELETAITAAA
jgi:hypothetical protein